MSSKDTATLEAPPSEKEPFEKLVTEEPAQEKPEKNPTKYMVMTGESKDGPWTPRGQFEGHGQMGAKKAAAAKFGDESKGLFFLAIPYSSYVPQKPAVKVTTSINF